MQGCHLMESIARFSFQRGWRGGKRTVSIAANVRHPRNLIEGKFEERGTDEAV